MSRKLLNAMSLLEVYFISVNLYSLRRCSCYAGYTGDGVTCVDVDECSYGVDNCNSNANCTNTEGSFTWVKWIFNFNFVIFINKRFSEATLLLKIAWLHCAFGKPGSIESTSKMKRKNVLHSMGWTRLIKCRFDGDLSLITLLQSFQKFWPFWQYFILHHTL